IWRKNCGAHALDDLRRRLVEEDCVYILFPEGTRTRTGEMGSFKAGIGRLLAGTSVPLLPAYIQGAWAAFPPDRTLPRLKKISVRIGEPLVFETLPANRQGWESGSAAAEAAVRSLAG